MLSLEKCCSYVATCLDRKGTCHSKDMHLATGYQVSFILNFLAGYYSNCGKGFYTDGHAIYVVT